MNLNESATQKVARTCYSDIGVFFVADQRESDLWNDNIFDIHILYQS